MTIIEIIDAIERDLPEYQRLLRSDEVRGGFANITKPYFVGILRRDSDGKQILPGPAEGSFHAYGPTPAEALLQAYLRAREDATT